MSKPLLALSALLILTTVGLTASWAFLSSLDAVREANLRALFGFPLLLFGIWLVYYCDRTFDMYWGWRAWLLWCSAGLCIIASFILLLFRDRLSSLKDLL